MYDLFSHQTKSMYYLLVFLELSPTFIAFYYKSCTHTCIEESKPTFRFRTFVIGGVNHTLHRRIVMEICHLCVAVEAFLETPKRPATHQKDQFSSLYFLMGITWPDHHLLQQRIRVFSLICCYWTILKVWYSEAYESRKKGDSEKKSQCQLTNHVMNFSR